MSVKQERSPKSAPSLLSSAVTRDGYVTSELLQFERHSMLTSTGRHAQTKAASKFLPKLTSPRKTREQISEDGSTQELLEASGKQPSLQRSQSNTAAWERPPSIERVLSKLPSRTGPGS